MGLEKQLLFHVMNILQCLVKASIFQLYGSWPIFSKGCDKGNMAHLKARKASRLIIITGWSHVLRKRSLKI